MSDGQLTGLKRYERGMALEAKGVEPAKVAKQLGFKNEASWTSTKRYFQGQYEEKYLGNGPRETPEMPDFLKDLPQRIPVNAPETAPQHKEESMAADKRTALNTPKPMVKPGGEQKTNKGRRDWGREILLGQPGEDAPKVAAVNVSLHLRGKHLSMVSDGQMLGFRGITSKEKYMQVTLDTAHEYLEELRQGIQLAISHRDAL